MNIHPFLNYQTETEFELALTFAATFTGNSPEIPITIAVICQNMNNDDKHVMYESIIEKISIFDKYALFLGSKEKISVKISVSYFSFKNDFFP